MSRHDFQLPLDPPGTENRRWICMDCGESAVGILTDMNCEPDGITRTAEEGQDLLISLLDAPEGA